VGAAKPILTRPEGKGGLAVAFTIKVFREISGSRGVPGKEVVVHGTGKTAGRTDSQGAVSFDLPSGRDYKVYVDGREVHRGPIVGTCNVYI
jgi:hypothetical protein